MKFDYDGLSYIIEFERVLKANPGFAKGKPIERKRIHTTANVIKLLKDGSRTIVRTGTTAHHTKDRLSFEAGRKAALAKALYDAPTLKGGIPLMGQPLTKAFRTTIWKAYHGRTSSSGSAVKA